MVSLPTILLHESYSEYYLEYRYFLQKVTHMFGTIANCGYNGCSHGSQLHELLETWTDLQDTNIFDGYRSKTRNSWYFICLNCTVFHMASHFHKHSMLVHTWLQAVSHYIPMDAKDDVHWKEYSAEKCYGSTSYDKIIATTCSTGTDRTISLYTRGKHTSW